MRYIPRMEVAASETVPDPHAVLATIGWEAAELEPVTGGWDAHLWRFTTADGSAHALRLYRLGMSDEVGRAEIGRRESDAIRVLRGAGLPAPGVEATGTYEGSTFLVQQWLPGLPMLTHAESHPWDIWRMGRIFGRLQARLHSIQDESLPGLPGAVFEYVQDTRPSLVPLLEREMTSSAFVHLDFHPLNVLVRNRRISGIVDFSFAGSGDPRFDLGRTNATLSSAPIPPGPMKPILQQSRRLYRRAWKSGYVAESGHWPLDPLFEAFGAAFLLADVEYAVREGRGWATRKDLEANRAYLDACCKRAGV